MPKRKGNLNAIYISERLQESLRQIEYAPLTTVVAPMGYGKTTAVNWFLSERSQAEKTDIIRISVYSDNVTIFWKSVQDAFAYAGYPFLKDYPYPTDPATAGLLADAACRETMGDHPCYIFIDDFHLMTDHKVAGFICVLVNRLPANVHMIIASRDRFLPAAEILRLGNKVCQVGTDNLRLNHTELTVYAHKCGTELSDGQIKSLLYASEGWFSAIYLNLRTFSERGILPDSDSDIYSMFSAAMIDPLPPEQREFLAVMGLADEFTVEMAAFLSGSETAGALIKSMTEQNAFVTKLPDGVHYRFHHMMKECADRYFKTLPEEKQIAYRNRYGDWYKAHEMYIHAIGAYRISENYDALLEVIEADAGILLATLNPDEVIETLNKCPREILTRHPLAVLVLMRCMFNWQKIPVMMEMKGILMASVENNPTMDETERGNLLGECDLITSFLMYNDISAMSALHRNASRMMSRPAISLSNKGGWTFGSPSVLMMYYRQPGELAKYLAEMDECMPHYYKITEGHGMGAEKIMRAESCLMQGNFVDVQLLLEESYNMAESAKQENMVLCADFAAARLSLFHDIDLRCSAEERYRELLSHHNISQVNVWNAGYAYYHAVLDDADRIPEVFRDHELSTFTILMPGKPMNEMIESQVYLAQGAYPKVIARNGALLGMCQGMHYALVALHLTIQNAAAYEMLGKRAEAEAFFMKALKDAMPDGLVLPFAENYRYIRGLLDLASSPEEKEIVRRITELGELLEARISKRDGEAARAGAFVVLTNREYEIVTLMHQRMSGREIAEKLFLSEGSVKQYVNQIYSKLGIDGDRRSKREKLFSLFEKN
ncbi:MAG: LuxR C-terminal-related transcriptional regulator [Lachnospiraceae bacterium]|nr:LuxR C-terminal-related transcriptional regulator [Lachnospiraceae bacterium]